MDSLVQKSHSSQAIYGIACGSQVWPIRRSFALLAGIFRLSMLPAVGF
jgi:hypothetical protein